MMSQMTAASFINAVSVDVDNSVSADIPFVVIKVSSSLRVQTTVRPFILVYQLSCCLVLIACCDLQRALSVKYDHVTRNWRMQTCPKYWGETKVLGERW